MNELIDFLTGKTKDMVNKGQITDSQCDLLNLEIFDMIGEANLSGNLKTKSDFEYLKEEALVMLDAELAAL